MYCGGVLGRERLIYVADAVLLLLGGDFKMFEPTVSLGQLVAEALIPLFMVGFAVGVALFARAWWRQHKNRNLTLVQILGVKRILDVDQYTPPQDAMPRPRAQSKVALRARSVGMQVLQEFRVDHGRVVAQIADSRGRPTMWVEY